MASPSLDVTALGVAIAEDAGPEGDRAHQAGG
jgi:hypothetical protein